MTVAKSLPAWHGTLTASDWMLDGRPIRSDAQKAHWGKLDWSRAWVDTGPSPAGNLGPYWHVPWSLDGEVLWSRLYPKVTTSKWGPLLFQAVKEAMMKAPPVEIGARRGGGQ